MTQVQEGDPRGGREAGLAVDRRRPGRPRKVSPALVPLLRGEYATASPPESRRWELMLGSAMSAGLMAVGVGLRFIA